MRHGWDPVAKVPLYIASQLTGRSSGVLDAHLMFGEPLLQLSHRVRAGSAQLFSEFVATFGLLAVIWGCSRKRSESVPFAVGLYITGASGSPPQRRLRTRPSQSPAH